MHDFVILIAELLPVLLVEFYCFHSFEIRFYVVHSDTEEEEVQVSIWPVCLDPYDSDCSVYSVFFHSSQYFRGNFLVIQLKSISSILNRFSLSFMFHLLRLCYFAAEIILWSLNFALRLF